MTNDNQQITPNSFLRVLSILHYAFMGAVSMFAIAVYFITDTWTLNLSDTSDIFFIVVPIVAVSGLLASKYIYQKHIVALSGKTGLKDKLIGIQTAFILKYGLIEGPALLTVVAGFLSGNLFYLIIAAVLITYFYMQKPTKDRIERDLNLNGELKSQFQKSNQVIE